MTAVLWTFGILAFLGVCLMVRGLAIIGASADRAEEQCWRELQGGEGA